MTKTKQKQNIPRGWKTHIISDLCDSLDNRRIPITKSDRISGDIPYYGATGVIDYVADYTFDEEILLIGEDGADWLPYSNKAFIVKGKSWVNNHVHVLKCKDVSSHEYLEQYLNWKNLDIYTTGGTRKKLNKEVLMNIPVCLPESKAEQQKIAEILGAVDEDIAKTQEVIETTEKLKRGLMQRLFTRGLGHTKFKETKIGQIPKEWKVLPLSKVADVIDSLHRTPIFSDSGFAMVRVTDIKNGFLNLDKASRVSEDIYREFTSNYAPKRNDIVLSRVGSYGISSYVNTDKKFCMGQNTVVINCHTESKYIFYALNSDLIKEAIENEVAGSGYKSLSLKSIRDLQIPIPEKDEQQKIAEILSAVDEKILINKKLKEKLNLLKKGLMQDLLSGKVRVK